MSILFDPQTRTMATANCGCLGLQNPVPVQGNYHLGHAFILTYPYLTKDFHGWPDVSMVQVENNLCLVYLSSYHIYTYERNFAAGDGHSLLCTEALTFFSHKEAYLRQEGATVACG